jgi:hypothetical protein
MHSLCEKLNGVHKKGTRNQTLLVTQVNAVSDSEWTSHSFRAELTGSYSTTQLTNMK